MASDHARLGGPARRTATAMAEVDLNLSLPPDVRRATLAPHAAAAGQLLDSYLRDLGALASFGSLIESYAAAFVSEEHRAEMTSIARIVGRSEANVLLGNLYYEAFRQLMGCTAFACEGP